jgi:hypothetical protein
MLWFGALLVVLAGVCQGVSTIYGIPVEDREQFSYKAGKLGYRLHELLSNEQLVPHWFK